jgi:hypothetical protein
LHALEIYVILSCSHLGLLLCAPGHTANPVFAAGLGLPVHCHFWLMLAPPGLASWSARGGPLYVLCVVAFVSGLVGHPGSRVGAVACVARFCHLFLWGCCRGVNCGCGAPDKGRVRRWR